MGAGKGTEEENPSAGHAVSVITWYYANIHFIDGKLNDSLAISTGLLAFGYLALEKLFPDLREECKDVDIRYFTVGNDYIAMLIRVPV